MTIEMPREAQIPVIWLARTLGGKAPICIGEVEIRPRLPLATLLENEILSIPYGEETDHFKIEKVTWGNGPNILSLTKMDAEAIRQALFQERPIYTLTSEQIAQ